MILQARISVVMTQNTQSFTLSDTHETLALGAQLAPLMRRGDVVALTGGLGAGKTTLARGLIQTLMGEIEVPSPTYTLVQTYDGPDFDLWHCDMYRLDQPEDGYELGLLDAFEDAACLIEWPENLGHIMPSDAMSVHIDFAGEGRIVTLTGWPPLKRETE